MKRIASAITTLILLAAIASCGTSTGSRYEKKETTPKTSDADKKAERDKRELIEDFDITPYKTKISIDENEPANQSPVVSNDVWYDYPAESTPSEDSSTQDISQVEGYRVQVITTDDLDEANEIRAEIYFKTNHKNIYIIFDPPFYKVKVGDFTNISDANSLVFKLNQMGYSEARVVSELVNLKR
jgi:cell division septation protein DedD